jgi:hypothetical protein
MFWMSTVLGMLFVDSESDQFLYLGGIYGLFFSSWLSAMLGTVGAMFALGLYAFVLAVAGISNFIPWMKNLFSKPPKPENENLDDVPEPAMAGGFTAPVQPVEDNAISKVITEEDHVKAVFDPDSFNDDDLEVENTISAKDIAMSIESRMKSDGRVAKEPEMEVEQNLNRRCMWKNLKRMTRNIRTLRLKIMTRHLICHRTNIQPLIYWMNILREMPKLATKN